MKTLKKRILAYTLALAILLSSLVMGASTVGATTSAIDAAVWDGTTATEFAGGDGSEGNPFIIENGAQLHKMVVEYSTKTASDGKFFRITEDIYLNDVSDGRQVKNLSDKKNWLAGYEDGTIATPSKENSFYGSLDGSGHTIYGLYAAGSGNLLGLFPAITNGTVVKNLNFENIFLNGGNCIGATIAGRAIYSNWQKTAQIVNCSVTNAVIGQYENMEIAAGLVGDVTSVKMNFVDCYADDVVASAWSATAGIVANDYNDATIKINNCYSAGIYPVSVSINKATCTNVYTDVAAPEGNVTENIVTLTEEQMLGDAAKTNMAGFNFKYTWQTVENAYPVFNKNVSPVWDGKKFTGFASFKGTGTAADPYQIEDASQLAYVVATDLTDGLYFKLVKDIRINDTVSENWKDTAINWIWANVRFVGTFDGDGHTIDGLYFNGSQKRMGLFSYTGDTLIKNVKFSNAYINDTTSDEGVAIVAGQSSATTAFDCIYVDETCYLNAPNSSGVAAITARGNTNGNNADAIISNSAVLATISGKGSVGAFAGAYWAADANVSINNCFTTSNLPLFGYASKTLTASANNYNTVADTSGATVLTADQMKGENAKTYMPELDYYCIWKTVENGYPVLKDGGVSPWSGAPADTSTVSYAGGDGTKANPYKIENGDQLYKMVAENSNQPTNTVAETKTYFELTADINLGNKQWYNVGKTSYPNTTNYTTGFAGVIYGNGYSIYNFSNAASVGVAGLIPVATQGAEFYDVHLIGGNVPKTVWNDYANGGLIGLAAGTGNSTPITIVGCSVEDYTISARDGAAAFVGDNYSQSLIIKDCYALNNDITHTSTTATMNSGAFVGIADGNHIGNSIVIENSFTDISATVGYVSEISTSFRNVYTVLDSYDGSVEGLTKLTADQMTGAAAKTNMNGLNFNQTWKTADGGYPVHTDMDYRATFWNGTAATTFAGGTGSEAEPYLISDAQQLYLLANLDRETTLGKFYKLTNNIAISNTYSDWANDDPYTWAVKKVYLDGFTYVSSFAGTLDGAGFTVSGLYYNNAVVGDGAYAYGLLPFVTADAVIKNITVSDVDATVAGNAYVGAVSGAVHVMEEDLAASKLHAVQFVGVNADNVNINADVYGDVLGAATRGVKFELCNATKLFGNIEGDYAERNCNNDMAYTEDTIIYNSLNIDAAALTNIKKVLLGVSDTYITTVNLDGSFDIRDLIAAKKGTVSVGAEEKLVWSQEFDADKIDTSVWTKSSAAMSTGTTLEYKDTATFDDGVMSLNCYDSGKTDANGNTIYQINHALNTLDTMSFKYGRLEMRAKVPFGAGAFPALWLTSRNAMGNDKVCDYSTEIDIFEVFGKTASANRMETCIHKWYNDENGNKIFVDGKAQECSCGTGYSAGNGYEINVEDRSVVMNAAAQNEFHTIAFEWTKDTMTFSVDGVVFFTANKSDMDNAKQSIAGFAEVTGFDITDYDTDNEGIFNQFMSVVITNHMYTVGDGASYTYQGNASDINPEKLSYEIDYIRLYQTADGEINLK